MNRRMAISEAEQAHQRRVDTFLEFFGTLTVFGIALVLVMVWMVAW